MILLPIYAPAGTSIVVDSAILHTRLDGDGNAPRRMLHVSCSRFSWERTSTGWRGPAGGEVPEPEPTFEMKALVPERLALSEDSAVRQFYSRWTTCQHEWAAVGFDPAYRTQRAVLGSPDPAVRVIDARCQGVDLSQVEPDEEL